jgi:hypothetical protein
MLPTPFEQMPRLSLSLVQGFQSTVDERQNLHDGRAVAPPVEYVATTCGKGDEASSLANDAPVEF